MGTSTGWASAGRCGNAGVDVDLACSPRLLWPTVPASSRALGAALASLSRRQRQVAVLVAGCGLSHAETAAILGVSRSSVQNHAERAMAKLRLALGVGE